MKPKQTTLLEVLKPGKRMEGKGSEAELRTYKSIFGEKMFLLTYPSLASTNRLEDRAFGSQQAAHNFFILNPGYGLGKAETK